jgi:hypothetical protein
MSSEQVRTQLRHTTVETQKHYEKDDLANPGLGHEVRPAQMQGHDGINLACPAIKERAELRHTLIKSQLRWERRYLANLRAVEGLCAKI